VHRWQLKTLGCTTLRVPTQAPIPHFLSAYACQPPVVALQFAGACVFLILLAAYSRVWNTLDSPTAVVRIAAVICHSTQRPPISRSFALASCESNPSDKQGLTAHTAAHPSVLPSPLTFPQSAPSRGKVTYRSGRSSVFVLEAQNPPAGLGAGTPQQRQSLIYHHVKSHFAPA
jgi:hypothetical protein